MLASGAIKLFPMAVREYSTAGDFDSVTRLATNPVDSRLRRVLVRIRCEMPPRRRRSFPWRCGPSRRVDKITTVHFPMKIVGTTFEPGIGGPLPRREQEHECTY